MARRYAPLWGGFTGPDPKAIDYPQFSPWAYCAGDPVNIIDKYGEDIIFVGANNSSLTFTTNWFSYSINLSPLGLDFKGNYTLPGGECASLMLDIIGIVEPTGIVDFANAGLRGLRGDFVGAGISVAGATLPYIGDLAKVSRIQEELAEYGVNFVWQHNRAIGKAAEKLVGIQLNKEFAKGEYEVLEQVYAKFDDGKMTVFDFVVKQGREPILVAEVKATNKEGLIEMSQFTKNQRMFFFEGKSVTFTGQVAKKANIDGLRISNETIDIRYYKAKY